MSKRTPTYVATSVRKRLCCAQRAVVKDQKLVGRGPRNTGDIGQEHPINRDSGGNLRRDAYEVGIAERREVCQRVEAATKLFANALVAHVVQCASVDSSAQRGTGAEQAATSAERSFFLFE